MKENDIDFITIETNALKQIASDLEEYFNLSLDILNRFLSEIFNDEFGINGEMLPEEELNSIPKFKVVCPLTGKQKSILDKPAYILSLDVKLEFPIEISRKKALDIFLKNTELNDDQKNTLKFVACIYANRDYLYDQIDEAVDEHLKYAFNIRPEMLELYTLINSHKKYDKAPSPLTIKYKNQEITIQNSGFWMLRMFDEYLNTYLGINSIDEAKEEKAINNGGRNPKDFYFSLIASCTYQYIKSKTYLKSEKITNSICNFLIDYLEAIGIDMDNKNKERIDVATMRSIISYYKKTDSKYTWGFYETGNIKYSKKNFTNRLW